VILVAGFATVFVALMYCTCICKEGRRVAPDGQPANVSLKQMLSSIGSYSRLLVNMVKISFLFRENFIGPIIGRKTLPFLNSEAKTKTVGPIKTSSLKMKSVIPVQETTLNFI